MRILIISLTALFLTGCGGGGVGNTFLAYKPAEKIREEIIENLTNENIKNAIRLYPKDINKSSWIIKREVPSGDTHIYRRNSENQFHEIDFGGFHDYIKTAVELNDKLYVFTYDPQRNVPSGRQLTGLSEGIDLWQFDPITLSAIRTAVSLPLGGIDDVITARAVNDGSVDACINTGCIRINPDGKFSNWMSDLPDNYEIVELKFSDSNAYAILREKADHVTGSVSYKNTRYAVTKIRNENSAELPYLKYIDQDCIPFRFMVNNNLPSWECANSINAYAELLRYDLMRMPHFGISDIGLNNYEGRIAWSQVYYLSALIQLQSSQISSIYSISEWDDIIRLAEVGIDLVAQLGSNDLDAYYSKRYSLTRKKLLFALHLGRIEQLINLAINNNYITNPMILAMRNIEAELKLLNNTAEKSAIINGFKTLKYEKGIDFWADGSNVPYNYVSGYVNGILSIKNNNDWTIPLAEELIRPILANEVISEDSIWHYWWGRGRTGWSESENISINTPSYSGQDGLAHISYRSIDAMAIIRLSKSSPSAIPSSIMRNIKNQIINGNLLPSVCQEYGCENLYIDKNVLVRYARSAAPAEIHSQIFALEALTR